MTAKFTTFHPFRKFLGSNMRTQNVEFGGTPLGQIWTFREKGERHGYHAKKLDGSYELFDTGNEKQDLVSAQLWMAA